MVRAEVDLLASWAADEGWNPGRDDLEVFWATDPDAFVAAVVGDEIVGAGSIVSYDGVYGFMGFFIVRPEHRGRGLGRELWFARRSMLLDRLGPGAAIEMDGVFAMTAFYADGGFVLQHRDLRFTGTVGEMPGTAAGSLADGSVSTNEVVDLAGVPFELIERYDRAHFAGPRPEFLRRWIARPGGHALGVVDGDRCRGYGVIRPAHVGYRIGPLFADDPAIAEALFAGLTARVPGAEVFLDVPERNAEAMDLAARHGMVEVFGCARMTLGTPPVVRWDEVYGVTTFELG